MAEKGQPGARVFLSYARADRARVAPLVAALEAAGHRVWWDAAIEGGHAFAAEIARELAAADAVVVAWSATSVASDWVLDEAADGRDRGVLVPVALDQTPPPLGFRQYQAVDLARWNGGADAPEAMAVLRAVARVSGDGATSPAQPPPVVRGRVAGVGRGAIVLAALAALIAGALGYLLWRTPRAEAERPIVALGEFTSTSPGATQQIARQLRDETFAAFGTESRLDVTSLDAAPPANAWVLTASLATQPSGDLRLVARLSDPASKAAAWAPRLEVAPQFAEAASQSLAADLATGVRCVLSAERATPRLSHRARVLWGNYCTSALDNARMSEQSAELLRQVTLEAPRFARAWGLLADVYSRSDAATAERYARAALAIDPNERYALGARYFAALTARDWSKAERTIGKALSFDPANAGWSHFQSAFLLFSTGRPRAAYPALERALALEPLSFTVNGAMAWAQAMAGDMVDAEDRFARIAARDRANFNGRLRLALAIASARHADARKLAAAQPENPLSASWIALIDALERQDASAVEGVGRQIVDAMRRPMPPLLRWELAHLLGAANRPREALLAVEQALEANGRNGYQYILLYHPALEAARRLPGFERIFEREGLMAYWRETGRPPEFCFRADAPSYCAKLTKQR